MARIEKLICLNKELAYNTFRNTQTNLNHFRGFLGRSAFKKSVTEIDEKLIEEYNDYLQDGRLNNTCVKSMQILGRFLRYCSKKKHISLSDLPRVETGTPNDITVIHLTYDEVMKIAYTPMPSKALDQVKDFFLFGCFTGMRYGDIANLNKSNICKDHIRFFIEKNGDTQTLTVPLVPVSKSIIEKYKNTSGPKAIPSINNQKTNDGLKLVAKYAGIDETLEIAKKDAYGKIRKKVYKKHETISCHTATIALTLDMPESVVKSITGHSKSSKAFHKNYHIVDERKFLQMNRLFKL